jgi:cytochrome bd-type quinol oxidase subunit 2
MASMTAVNPVPESTHPALWSLVTGALFLGSAVLQLIASLQRWVWLSDSWTRGNEYSIEDGRFDYFYPSDPWENLGTTAQFFGAGILLLAVGVLALARATPRRPGRATKIVALVTAVSFGITGVHALISGVMGVPSPLQSLPVLLVLSLVGFVGLLALAALSARSSWPASLACIALLGSSLPGNLIAAFVIAPQIAGYESHDTTPWTETVVAASTAIAALAMLTAAASRSARSS